MTINYFRKANQLKQEGKLEESVVFYQQALQSNPNFYCSYYNLAEALERLGKWHDATDFYQKAINLNPNSAWSYYGLGQVLVQSSKWSEALSAYLQTIKLSDFYLFYSRLGEIFEQIAINLTPESLGNYPWQDILPKSNQDIEVLDELYNLNDEEFLETSKHLESESFLERTYEVYLKRSADQEGKRYYASLMNQGMKRSEVLMAIRESEEFKDKLINALREINLYYLNDEMFLKSSDYLKNEPFVTEVYWTYLKREADHVGKGHYTQHLATGMPRIELISAFKQSAEFTTQLTASIKAICFKEAVQAYRRAIQMNPDSYKSKRNLGKALTYLGKMQAQTGQVDQAIATYQEAVSFSQEHAETYYEQANALLQQGQRDGAVQCFKKAIDCNPTWIDPYLSLGEILKLDRVEESIYWWKKALPYIDSESTRTDLQIKIGTMLVEQGKIDEAITTWQQSISHIQSEHNRIDIQFRIGNLLVQQGKLDEALEFIEDAMGLTDFSPSA